MVLPISISKTATCNHLDAIVVGRVEKHPVLCTRPFRGTMTCAAWRGLSCRLATKCIILFDVPEKQVDLLMQDAQDLWCWCQTRFQMLQLLAPSLQIDSGLPGSHSIDKIELLPLLCWVHLEQRA